jgi:hypothetical protein
MTQRGEEAPQPKALSQYGAGAYLVPAHCFDEGVAGVRLLTSFHLGLPLAGVHGFRPSPRSREDSWRSRRGVPLVLRTEVFNPPPRRGRVPSRESSTSVSSRSSRSS